MKSFRRFASPALPSCGELHCVSPGFSEISCPRLPLAIEVVVEVGR